MCEGVRKPQPKLSSSDIMFGPMVAQVKMPLDFSRNIFSEPRRRGALMLLLLLGLLAPCPRSPDTNTLTLHCLKVTVILEQRYEAFFNRKDDMFSVKITQYILRKSNS